ncbi:hypothetical protein Y1Q_0003200 [Alligator mississippiensis]|uniref:Uncharacterized protein n=1 Tax=Alligator mississippiensis TaxID=8496 RepID=A0A151MDU1_ALLMI|nr:hypothetical protein Y1Q_0003200 [Alligator mississippiensis]
MEEDMPPAGVEMWDSDYSSDDEISTKKELHFRLGEDNLDDTLEYDFSGPALRTGRSAAQKLQIGDSSPETEQEGGREPEPLGHKN